MSGLRVLLTNITLATRTGTEVNVRDIAIGLLGRGHTPVVYTPDPGEIAEELRRATVPVVDDLRRLGAPPDVIHGHHHPETMTALLHFPGVPAVFFSHDFLAWHDAAPQFPRILRYVAVDDANHDRLAFEHGIPADRIQVLLNAVDLARFPPRPPLPARPARALVFSNYASDRTHLGAVREACRRAGVTLDVVGADAGTPSRAPETLLGAYDLVFAKGRCALEALAVGAAVVLCDFGGVGPLVTSAALDRLRRQNFGRRLLSGPLEPAALVREMARYDAADAAEVSRRIRASAGLDRQLDALVALYREVIAEHAARPPDLAAEERAAAVYLRQWGPRFRDGPLRAEIDRLRGAHERLAVESATRAREADALRAELARAHAGAADLRAAEAALAPELARLRDELAWVRGSATWRLHDFLVRSRVLLRLYRGVKRLVSRRAGRLDERGALSRGPSTE
jgi:hypothetical protein